MALATEASNIMGRGLGCQTLYLQVATVSQEKRERERETKLPQELSYSVQGAMQVCDLDRHSVQGLGVAAVYHVPPARGTGFQLRLKLDLLI